MTGSTGRPGSSADIDSRLSANHGHHDHHDHHDHRNIGDHLKARLRVGEDQYGRSMKDEARDILRASPSCNGTGPASLVDAVRARIGSLGGVELELPPREILHTPPSLDV